MADSEQSSSMVKTYLERYPGPINLEMSKDANVVARALNTSLYAFTLDRQKFYVSTFRNSQAENWKDLSEQFIEMATAIGADKLSSAEFRELILSWRALALANTPDENSRITKYKKPPLVPFVILAVFLVFLIFMWVGH